MAFTTHPHLVLRLKKVCSRTSTPPLSLMACSRGNFTFTFTHDKYGYRHSSETDVVLARHYRDLCEISFVGYVKD